MCHNDGRFANHLFNKIVDQVRKGFSGIVDRWAIRKTKTQQVKGKDAELLRQRIDILVPLI